ncbi:zinc finger protein 77-like isoform X4 [Cydia fagiglandana]|uniref:zinc finger protein 77-like isoform X4 n=1 Tax=Cydia fagiglandana TaxID=1458189 RepID=UPI002FEE43CD
MNRQVDVKALVSHIVRGDGLDKCRICMGDTTEGQVYLGDTVMMDGERPVSLAELLEIITGIEVETSPLLPNRICGICANTIAPTISLIEYLRDSHRKWTDASNYLHQIEFKENVKTAYIIVDNDVKDVSTYTENVKRGQPEDILKYLKKRKQQQNAVKRRNELERQLRDSEINTGLKCPECEKSFLCVYKYNMHMRYYDKRACVHCKELIKIEDLKDHYKEHGVDTMQCDICYETFKKQDAFLKHKVTYHSKGPYFCYICKLSYRDPHHLASHMTSKHEPRICLACDKKFSNVYCFRTHTRKCKNSQRKGGVFICDICAKVYSSKYALKVHLEYIHMNKEHSHQCEHCGKVFNSAIHLLEHSNKHNRVPDRFVCNICGVPMSTRRGYQRHYKRHLKNPNYVPRGLKNAGKTKEKYKCEFCELKFGLFTRLREHVMNDHAMYTEFSWE